MKPVLYRYRDSESVIKHMDGYTPGEGWTPLYDNPQPERKHTDADLAAEYERGRKAGLTQAYDAALAQPERQPDADIDACIYAQCPDFDDAHEDPSLDDIRAIVRAAQPKPLFANLIAQHEGLAEELAAMDAQPSVPAWHDAPTEPGLWVVKTIVGPEAHNIEPHDINAEVSGAGTASAGLPGYTAGDNTE